ncbi:MAG: hypothetical protein EZS28_012122 [Streblomastix strix]|uniref:SPRY domain-containing protein n=1 Tax=Streblomastix strix TaxID=222440 RepID=A0A5J4WCH3_9EUKA|nr:MAG: hypothetical protein EZS28_012122 [Streblomastix strix]
MKYEIGIGIIDAKQNDIPHPFNYNNPRNNNTICLVGFTPFVKGNAKYGSGCKEIKQGDKVNVIVDLQSNPHTFCLAINKLIQPFCVKLIPNRVKFILLFGEKDGEWEFNSLEELAQGIDLSKIEERKCFKYE